MILKENRKSRVTGSELYFLSLMSRKPRLKKAGFYHIINRGVARTNIYLCDDDFLKFLEIVQEASEEFHFDA